MRPPELNAFFAPLTSLKGVGPRLGVLLEKAAGGPLVRDIAFTAPVGVVDRRLRARIAEAPPGAQVTILARVQRHEPPAGPKRPYRVRMADETGFLTLVFFNPNREHLAGALPVGALRVVSGEVTVFGAERQMTHPAAIAPPEEIDRVARVEPVYPLTAGLTLKMAQRAAEGAARLAPGGLDWLSPERLARRAWPGFPDALDKLHHPENAVDLSPKAPARERLAYDEHFARQLAYGLSALERRATPGRPVLGDGRFTTPLLAALPYQPTRAQQRAFAEIGADMARPSPMARLLQGDVGAGKTLVAAWAMARAAEGGFQAALMAPTDLLARQHAAALKPLLAQAGLRLEALTGRDTGAARAALLADLASGAIHVACGTHALFQDAVAFGDLGLVVIDEQHRFGVSDRRRLMAKGQAPHALAMSATPIPRTLELTAYGDLEVSHLDEKPPGRQPIATRALPLERMDELIGAVARAIARDDRVYWVCPMVAENELLDLSAAEERFAALQARFGETVALAHGQMPPRRKDAAMAAFREGAAKILVATTVIEVGVDVPEASVIVIEHAERFGLAQLHQLRGRVGRGGKAGACMLLYQAPLGETAKRRLEALRETDDGFLIAEIDWELRGAGDVLGVRQAGLPAYRFADPFEHADLQEAAREDALALLAQDPALSSPRGRAARAALWLFGQQDAAALLRAV